MLSAHSLLFYPRCGQFSERNKRDSVDMLGPECDSFFGSVCTHVLAEEDESGAIEGCMQKHRLV